MCQAPSPVYMQMSMCAYLISTRGIRRCVIASKMAEKKSQLLTDTTPHIALQEAALNLLQLYSNCSYVEQWQNVAIQHGNGQGQYTMSYLHTQAFL